MAEEKTRIVIEFEITPTELDSLDAYTKYVLMRNPQLIDNPNLPITRESALMLLTLHQLRLIHFAVQRAATMGLTNLAQLLNKDF